MGKHRRVPGDLGAVDLIRVDGIVITGGASVLDNLGSGQVVYDLFFVRVAWRNASCSGVTEKSIASSTVAPGAGLQTRLGVKPFFFTTKAEKNGLDRDYA